MDRFVELDGVKMRYRVSGDGKRPIVLMHGWGCNSSTLASIEKVASESCSVYNVDFPGFGESDEPSDVWGVEKYTEIIELLIRKEGLERPILLGHSFGGRVGILYASRHEDVEKLILVDAAGIKAKRGLKYYYKVYSYKLYKRFVNLFFGKEKGQQLIEKAQKKKGSSDYASASSRMRAVMSRVVNEDLTDRLNHIKAPTLLVWGENDTATPISDAKKMEKLIPNAGLVSFPGCGHYSFLDNPRQFQAVLRSFLNS